MNEIALNRAALGSMRDFMSRTVRAFFATLTSTAAIGRFRTCLACRQPASAILCPACARASGLHPNGGKPHAGDGLARLSTVYHCAKYSGGGDLAGRSPLVHCLHQFKYGGDRYAGRELGRLFAGLLGRLSVRFSAVIPIPLHRARLSERGFNQAAWLARAAARTLKTEFLVRALERTQATQAQQTLGAVRRRANMAGVFRARRDFPKSARLLLVDDVLTTGATSEDAARALLEAGAGRVDCAVLLRAVAPHED